jgi:hypothetical protein
MVFDTGHHLTEQINIHLNIHPDFFRISEAGTLFLDAFNVMKDLL